MKNFFKKLSFVLAIAMVLTSLAPATASAAAKNYVKDSRTGKKVTAIYAYIGGSVATLTPYVNGKKASKVTIENSDPTKVDVSNKGVVTPLKNGTATLTFKSGKTTIAKVTVKARTRAKSLNIYDRAEYAAGKKEKLTEVALKVGETKDLQVTMPISKAAKKAGGKKSSYFAYAKSSNEDVVTVTKNDDTQRNFTVKAVAAGSAKVTIVANQKTEKNVRADKYYVEASFDVTVKDEKLAAKQTSANVVTVTGTDLTDKVADYTLKFGTATKTLTKAVKKEDGSVELTVGTSTMTKGTYTLGFGELTTEFEAAPSEVTSIEIIPEKAILKSETDAIAYYKVFDQFGDDVTKKAFSNLSVTGSDVSDATKAGEVKFHTSSGKYNLNLSQVSLSIVDKTNGVVCSKILTISENSKLAEVTLAGLYKIEGGTYKAVKSIPEGTLTTALANYKLLVSGVDQYGLEFPAEEINKDNLSLTLSSVTGLQADITASGAAVTKEIDDVTYFVVDLKNTSSDAATKGLRAGEVNAMGVVLTSGKTFTGKFEVSNAVKIDKIKISATDTIYGGQDNVLSYTITDTEGNEITDIDTLCQLNHTDYLKEFGTKVKFVGSKDGTAVLLYTAASTTNNTTDTLSWISPTLEYGFTSFSIVPDRKAVAVVGTWSWPETGYNVGADLTTTSNGTVKVPLKAYKYEDQYGNLIPWYEYGTVVAGSTLSVSNEFKTALPSYITAHSEAAGVVATAGAVTASAINKVKVTTVATLPGVTKAIENEYTYQVAFVEISDVTGLSMYTLHGTYESDNATADGVTSPAAFGVSGYYAGMGVDLQATDFSVIDGTYARINVNRVGYDKTVDDSASVVVNNSVGTVLKTDFKVSNEKAKVVKADAYTKAFSGGYRTVSAGAAVVDLASDVKWTDQYDTVRRSTLAPRVTLSNLPADNTKYTLTNNGKNNVSLTFNTAGWYTVKAQYDFAGFVYDAVLVFEVR